MKAMLVMDMPSACWECMLCGRGIKERFCIARIYEQGNANDCDIKDLNKVESWCPLKPLPRKIEVDVKKIEDIMHVEYQTIDVIQDKIRADIKLETNKLIALGWNACIDKISGE